MKISICGKGGSGKSSLTALLAGTLTRREIPVLVIDADESNSGLYRLLGTTPPVNLLDHLGGKANFKKSINQTFPPPEGALFKEELTIAELPAECVAAANGLKLVSVGKIHHAGEGCACSLGLLSKMVLSRLRLHPGEVVLIDTEAGVEHFGRGVDTGCDLILAVVDPVFESFLLAQKIDAMAREEGTEVFFILNKSDSRTEAVVYEHIDKNRVIARIPYSESLFTASLKGEALLTDMEEITPVSQLIQKKLRGSPQ